LQEAVDKYDTVIANLEFARELQKQFQSMSDEVCTRYGLTYTSECQWKCPRKDIVGRLCA